MLELIGLASAVLLSANASATNVDGDNVKPEDKMVCRKLEETGSLIRKKRVCHTRAEWERLSEAARRDTQDMQTAKNGTNNGN